LHNIPQYSTTPPTTLKHESEQNKDKNKQRHSPDPKFPAPTNLFVSALDQQPSLGKQEEKLRNSISQQEKDVGEVVNQRVEQETTPPDCTGNWTSTEAVLGRSHAIYQAKRGQRGRDNQTLTRHCHPPTGLEPLVASNQLTVTCLVGVAGEKR
jgi:hypothetical protein